VSAKTEDRWGKETGCERRVDIGEIGTRVDTVGKFWEKPGKGSIEKRSAAEDN